MVNAWFSDVRTGIPGHRNFLYRTTSHDAPLTQFGSILWNPGTYTLWIFLSNRRHASGIPILGEQLSCQALYAYISESNTCRIRTKIFNCILPVPAYIFISAINHYTATQISLNLSEFY
jgi:hypothetical protein